MRRRSVGPDDARVVIFLTRAPFKGAVFWAQKGRLAIFFFTFLVFGRRAPEKRKWAVAA
jgi:hypothetical protein